MATLLLTWDGSEDGYKPQDYVEHVASTSAGRPASDRWSVGRRARPVAVDDGVFLLRQGTERGIVASGRITRPDIVIEPHWREPSRTARYVYLEWDTVVPVADRLPVEQLKTQAPGPLWDAIFESGRDLRSEDAVAVSAAWAAHLGTDGVGATWDVEVGTHLDRATRTQRYGGGQYGGMEPSAKTPNVFLYSDPSKGARFGYNFDGWAPGGHLYYYTGEGPVGDQTWTAGNLGLLRHRDMGRSVRLFVADGYVTGQTRNHVYIGEFALEEEHPYSLEDAPDENGENRSVFVFRLRPRGPSLVRDKDRSTALVATNDLTALLVDVEKDTDYAFETPGSPPATATKREAQLVARYLLHLTGLNHDVKRWRLTPDAQVHAMLTDLYDTTDSELYEAKGSISRAHVRLAIGQLFDYRRYLTPPPAKITILLPGRPATDLLELMDSLGIGCVWETPSHGFERR